jgi:hypothetical protein
MESEQATIRNEERLTAAINALPRPLRDYIRDLACRCDPTGDVQRLFLVRERLRFAEELLGRMEWEYDPLDGDFGSTRCAVCGERQPGHSPDCDLAAFLGR